jgi:hypothetical protein
MDKIGLFAFIRPFYSKTLGLWALILIVGGILMEVRQHILIGRFFFKNPIVFWILPLVIILFGWIHLTIQKKLLQSPEYQVFHQLGLFSKKDLWLFWSRILLANFIPLLGYFLFLSYFAGEQQAFLKGGILWATTLFILFFSFLRIRKILSLPLKELDIYRSYFPWPFPRFAWVLLSLRQNRPILLLITKAFSLLLMNGFFFSFQSGNYDLRWLHFAILCVAFIQFPLILEKTEKELEQQTWILSLPLTIPVKLFYQLGSLILLVLPEIFFLGWKGLNSSFPTDYIILAIVLVCDMAALQFLIHQKKEIPSLPNWVAGLFFLLFLGIIFGFPWWVFFLGTFTLLIRQFRSPYHF